MEPVFARLNLLRRWKKRTLAGVWEEEVTAGSDGPQKAETLEVSRVDSKQTFRVKLPSNEALKQWVNAITELQDQHRIMNTESSSDAVFIARATQYLEDWGAKTDAHRLPQGPFDWWSSRLVG
jgi:hypothetical protein